MHAQLRHSSVGETACVNKSVDPREGDVISSGQNEGKTCSPWFQVAPMEVAMVINGQFDVGLKKLAIASQSHSGILNMHT